MYINDLVNISKFETRLFAEDTALLLNNVDLKTFNETVNLELAAVANWLKINKLSLNYPKSHYLLIQPSKKQSISYDFKVNIGGTKTTRCRSARYLGVILDDELT